MLFAQYAFPLRSRAAKARSGCKSRKRSAVFHRSDPPWLDADIPIAWLPPGLEVSDVAVFAKDDRQWAQFPSEPMRDREGAPLTDASGRVRYRSSMKWASRELQEGFSTALIELIRQRHPEAFEGGAS